MATSRLTLFAFASLIFTMNASAQFDALPDSDATWTETFWIGPGEPYQGFFYMYDPVSPDTLYNGDVYKKLVTIYSSGGSIFSPAYGGALRDNGMGQVYYWEVGAPDPVLLYDFDVLPGDSLYQVFGLLTTAVRVYAVDTVVVNGTQRRRVSVECLDGSGFYGEEWTQGIGSNHGLLHSVPCGSVSGIGTLVCMTANDTVQYGVNVGAVGDCVLVLGQGETGAEEEALVIYPNPATDRLTIAREGNTRVDVEVFGPDGRSVMKAPLIGTELSIAALPAGAYVLKAREGSGALRIARFVKR